MKILIADDDREIVKVLSIGFEAKGFEVVVARDAMQAVMFAKQQQPAAVLLDINMPGGNGLDVLKRLKMAPQTRDIPVIIISATTDAAIPDKVKEMGAVEFVGKPFELESLHQIVCKVVGKQ